VVVRVITALPINLILSLIFGAGQVAVGGLFARHCLRQGIWADARRFLLLLVSLWFICSGFLELFVSGMETAERLGGRFPTPAFELWRARADTLLLLVSLALLVSLLAYLILKRFRAGS
jgi:hypothetical protein